MNGGYIEKDYLEYAVKGFNGLIEHTIDYDDKSWTHKGTFIGIGVGDYDFYLGLRGVYYGIY